MNRKRIKDAVAAAARLQAAAGPEGIEARAEATITSLASLNARGTPVSLTMINEAVDKYLLIASDKLMQEDALNRLGVIASRGITVETIRSTFWNNLTAVIARRLLAVMGKRPTKRRR